MRILLLSLIVIPLISSCFPYQISYCLQGRIKNIKSLESVAKEYSKKGFKEGDFCYGYVLLKEGKPGKALPYLIKAYRKGFTRASYFVGKAYEMIEENKKASYWYFKAIEEGNVNSDFFRTARYISKSQLDELYSLGRQHPIIYLYLGDYFFRSDFYDAALYYYQLAIRYGFERAKLMAGLSLYKLGNKNDALNTLYSLYKEGDRKGAEAIGTLLEREADTYGGCTAEKAKSPKDFVKERAGVFKEKERLYTLAARFYNLAGDKKSAERSSRKALFYSPEKKGKELLPKNARKLSYSEVLGLCREGVEWPELLVASKRGKEFKRAAEEFYTSMGFRLKEKIESADNNYQK